jgi:hypothetical protein
MFRKPTAKKCPTASLLLRTVGGIDDDDEDERSGGKTGQTAASTAAAGRRRKKPKGNAWQQSAPPPPPPPPQLAMAMAMDEPDLLLDDGGRLPGLAAGVFRRRGGGGDGGLGYGGGGIAMDPEEDGSNDDDTNNWSDDKKDPCVDPNKGGVSGDQGAVSAAAPAALYDKASLSRLLAEQRRYVAPPPAPPPEDDYKVDVQVADGSPSGARTEPPPARFTHHLWGDDPLFDSRGIHAPSEANVDHPSTPLEPPRPPPAPPLQGPFDDETRIIPQRKIASLEQIREGLAAAIASIAQRREQVLAPQIRQVRVQQEQARLEAERRGVQVRESGHAVEYYQQLRQTLADWVGALRQLQSKTVRVQAGLHGLLAEMNCHQRRRDWQADMVAVLFKHNRLDRVLGHQVDHPDELFDPLQTDVVAVSRAGDGDGDGGVFAVAAGADSVDEFGRSVQSQSTLQREHRRRRRNRIRRQRGGQDRPHQESLDLLQDGDRRLSSQCWREDESDAYLSDEEKETFRERHDALLRALDVARRELDDDFTSLQNLVNVFAEWKQEYGDDYQQCYASLSLADLASVLILTELCALNDPWNESGGYNEGKWIAVIKSAMDLALLDEAGFDRVLEKSVYPSVCDLLNRYGYAIMSSRQSSALSSFVRHVTKIAPPSSLYMEKTKRKVQEYITLSLLNLTIPIVRNIPQSTLENDELEEVIHGATVGQMHVLKKLLVNIVTYWGPILEADDAFVQSVLDFISTKFLFLLSSLQQDVTASKFSESPSELFREVWDALLPTGWLTDPKWMLQTVAIRAAHAAYSDRSSTIVRSLNE